MVNKALEEEKMRECKFKPELVSTKKFTNLESAYNPKNYDSKMQEYLKRKEIEVGLCLPRPNKSRASKTTSSSKTVLSSRKQTRGSKPISGPRLTLSSEESTV